MATVRKVTTTERTHVVYEVFVGGTRKWVCTVFFRRDKLHRAGGFAFVEMARKQESVAEKLMEDPHASV